MKYFTKEWYDLCQNTSLHFFKEYEREAETYSEDYFQQLYTQRLAEFIAEQKEVSEATFEEVYPVELDPDCFVEDMTDEEIERMKCSYQQWRKDAEEYFVNSEPFDEELATEQFYEAFLYNSAMIEKSLPKEILEMIADVRVFVLNKASIQVILKVTQFSKNNEKAANRVVREYNNYLKKARDTINAEILQGLMLHDCVIANSEMKNGHLKLSIDNSGGFVRVSEVEFDDCKIIKQDVDLTGLIWLNEEVYFIENLFEIHVLLFDKNSWTKELILSAKNVHFKFDD